MRPLFLLLFVAFLISANSSAAVASDEAPIFVTKWGSTGTGDGQFEFPSDIALDDSGHVYVTDNVLERVQKFSSDGVYQMQFGDSGSAPGEFLLPWGIAIDASNYLYVVDVLKNKVQKYDRNGNFVLDWDHQGGPSPAIHPNGNVYVGDDIANRIEVYESDGNHLYGWGVNAALPGTFANINFMDIDFRGFVYSSDCGLNRVNKYSTIGVVLEVWDVFGNVGGELNDPEGIATDSLGNVYVANLSSHRISKYDSSGIYRLSFGTFGAGNGQFASPLGIAITPPNLIYVIDRDNDRIQKFRVPTRPRVEVLSPVMDDYLTPGDNVNIQWSASDDMAVSSVDIGLVTQSRLYGSSSSPGSPSSFYEINPLTGVDTFIGNIGFDRVGAMSTDPRTGKLLATAQRTNTDVAVLIEIDPFTGIGTEIGTTAIPGNITDLSFNRETGKLWAHRPSQQSDSVTEFYNMDTHTGMATLVGPTAVSGSGGGFTFALNNRPFLVLTPDDGPAEYQVNLNTGKAVFPVKYRMPPSAGTPRIRALDVDPIHGTMYALVHDGLETYLATINTVVDTVVKVSTLATLDLDGLCFGPGDYLSIATGEADDGSYTWVVPDYPTPSGRIKITVVDADGLKESDTNSQFFSILNVTDVSPFDPVTNAFLASPAPNPFLSHTTIRFSLSRPGHARLSIYDARGRWVRNLIDGFQSAGEKRIGWDGTDRTGRQVATGIYYLRLETPSGVHRQRANVVR